MVALTIRRDHPKDTIDRANLSARLMMSSNLLPVICEESELLETTRSSATSSKIAIARPTPVYPTTTANMELSKRQELILTLRREKRRLFLQSVLQDDTGGTNSYDCHSLKLSAHRALVMATLDTPRSTHKTELYGANSRAQENTLKDLANRSDNVKTRAFVAGSPFKDKTPSARAPAA